MNLLREPEKRPNTFGLDLGSESGTTTGAEPPHLALVCCRLWVGLVNVCPQS